MNRPLGGKLISAVIPASESRQFSRKNELPQIPLSPDRVLEARNIATGVYSPLKGFMGQKDIASVLRSLKLTSGVFWPIPIILDVDGKIIPALKKASQALLVEAETKKVIGLIEINEIFKFSKIKFCKDVFGTNDPIHPGVAKIKTMQDWLVAGNIKMFPLPRSEFGSFSLTPVQTREIFASKNWQTIVGFHTRNVPHRGHEHVQRKALDLTDGIFLNPLMGNKKKGDFTNEAVLKAYKYFVAKVMPQGKAVLGVLEYSPYYAGPREALLTAILRKNFGCTHFIVGRDHTGVGNFYQPQQYAQMIKKYSRSMGIKVLHYGRAFWCYGCKAMRLEGQCRHTADLHLHPSGTKIRHAMIKKTKLPPEMIRPDILRLVSTMKKIFT